jgi:hypothetical protein
MRTTRPGVSAAARGAETREHRPAPHLGGARTPEQLVPRLVNKASERFAKLEARIEALVILQTEASRLLMEVIRGRESEEGAQNTRTPGQGIPQGRHHVRGGEGHRDGFRHTAKGGSPRRCWPTSPCRRWRSTSAPRTITAPDGGGRSTARTAGPTTGLSVTRTISRSWYAAPKPTRTHCGRRSPTCSPRWGYACGVQDPRDPPGRGVRLRGVPHPAAHQEGHTTRKTVYTYPSKKALASIRRGTCHGPFDP